MTPLGAYFKMALVLSSWKILIVESIAFVKSNGVEEQYVTNEISETCKMMKKRVMTELKFDLTKPIKA